MEISRIVSRKIAGDQEFKTHKKISFKDGDYTEEYFFSIDGIVVSQTDFYQRLYFSQRLDNSKESSWKDDELYYGVKK